MIIGGSGDGKTETVTSLREGAFFESHLTNASSLMSHTPKKEAEGGTGGILRKMGNRGILILKDFTSVLSRPYEARQEILAALREIYDGYWIRSSGADGGRTTEWEGRITIIGASTSEYDRHYGVISQMGERFMLVRLDGRRNRREKGRQARDNSEHEVQMRAELSECVTGLLEAVEPESLPALTVEDEDRLLDVADIATLMRTPARREDGVFLGMYEPEQPTRFLKQLKQLVRGGMAIGLSREAAMRAAMRCARDSIEQRRLAIMLALLEEKAMQREDIVKAAHIPRSTVARALEELEDLELTQRGRINDKLWKLSDEVDIPSLELLKKGGLGQ